MADGRMLDRASRLRTGRTPFVLATVVRAERPTSARPGDQALVLADGTIEGFVGGSCAESTTRVESLRVLTSGEAGLLRITPGGGAGAPPQPGVRVVDNPCLSGGALEIFLEPVLPPALVLVVGDAPVARALLRVGRALDHEVVPVVDTAALLPDDTSALVVASHGHDDEEGALAAALAAGVPYVAMVASRKRAAGVLDAVRARGVRGTERVHAPAGLDLGARTPNEIALSIYAELVAERSGRAGNQDGHPQVRPGQEGGLPDFAAVAEPRRGPVIDPVCGMEVVPVEPTLSVVVGEELVWFCGPGCRAAYLADPGGFPK
jgi:xanthine dehydrogenase accessory factor